MRTTHKEVENVFKNLIKHMGCEVAQSYKDNGKYALDHQAVYGGYQIVQYSGVNGGEHLPFGTKRRSASEMVDVMNFAITALEYLGFAEVN